LIIGRGLTVSVLLQLTAGYTDLKQGAMLEKQAAPARGNSLHSNDSQTWHCGDIESDYSLEKALKMQRAARMVEHYRPHDWTSTTSSSGIRRGSSSAVRSAI
jgi:malate dehydrogenase (quinone)